MGGAITGGEEGTDVEKEGDRHPPDVISPPTFQPRLRLWLASSSPFIFSRFQLVLGLNRSATEPPVSLSGVMCVLAV